MAPGVYRTDGRGWSACTYALYGPNRQGLAPRGGSWQGTSGIATPAYPQQNWIEVYEGTSVEFTGGCRWLPAAH